MVTGKIVSTPLARRSEAVTLRALASLQSDLTP
jgi:hypothetical protein